VTKKLLPTGERLLPEMNDPAIMIEHLHRYALAKLLCTEKIVLDIASGEGYGSDILSQSAKEVIGVDIDEDSVLHANNKYKRENLHFKKGSTDSIPLGDRSVDLVVSFETIEHHDKHHEMMAEIKRVLKPDGVVILSTPDKKYYSDIPGYKNPFHVKELYKNEFFDLVAQYFPFVQQFGQSAGIASILFPIGEGSLKDAWSAGGDESNLSISDSLHPLYLIAIASQSKIDYKAISVFDGSVIRDKARRVAEKEIQDIYKSRSYRLGFILLSPFRWIKRILTS